ncbi:hypothetical protein G6F57_018415 [Rhizopus arrhizus]|nr:hypothetical protein G6F57_018415 [Rhizopus arrhizus]
MARHVDHVIRAAKYEPVAVGIHPPPVEGRIHLASGDRREVGLHETRVVAPDGGHGTRRQRRHDRHHALLVRPQVFAGGFADDARVEPVHRKGRAAESGRHALHPRLGRQDGPAGFGLPVVVDDGLAQAFRYPVGGRSWRFSSAGSWRFRTRTAVGAENSVFTPYCSTSFHRMAPSGRTGVPS